jgi:hypothetical protein
MIAVAHLAAFVIAASSGAPCHVDVAPGDGLPEADRIRGCTPGRYVALSRAEACASKDRPSTPAAARTMRLRTARRIFAADWRVYYRRYRRRGLL